MCLSICILQSNRICPYACIGAPWANEPTVAACAKFLHIAVWMMYTDSGSDQVGASAMIARDVASDSTILIFTQCCLLHQFALIIRRQLALLNPYWSQLAKLVNLWRTCSIVCEIGKVSSRPCRITYTLASWVRIRTGATIAHPGLPDALL